MVLLQQYGRIFEDDTYIESYLRKKETDCILYSINGVEFNIHKEILFQTKFMQNILLSAHSTCCGTIEIITPCSEAELDCVVNFLYRFIILLMNISEGLTKVVHNSILNKYT